MINSKIKYLPPKIQLLLIIYILLFAAFPYIHCHADKSICDISFIEPIVDHSCCEIHSANNDSRHDHHTHFLLEEAGTNNRSNQVKKSDILNHAEIIKDQKAIYLKPLFVNIRQYNIAKPVNGFHALYSDLSPPII